MTTRLETVMLEQPVQRGEQTIATLQLRKPAAGEMRGIALTQLLNMQADALIELLPRISSPPLTGAEVEAMDVADLTSCAMVIADFFTPASLKTAAGTA